MIKDKALFGLLSGIGLIVATLIGVAVINAPPAESATAISDPSHSSCVGKPAFEQGYGIRTQSNCTAK